MKRQFKMRNIPHPILMLCSYSRSFPLISKFKCRWKYKLTGSMQGTWNVVEKLQSPKPICKANMSLSISMSSTHWRQKSRSLTRTTTTTAAPVTTESKWKQPKQAVLHAHIQLNAVWPSERKFLPHYTVENWVDHTKPNKHTAERDTAWLHLFQILRQRGGKVQFRDRKQKGGPKGVETNVLTLLQSFGHKKMRVFKRVVYNCYAVL